MMTLFLDRYTNSCSLQCWGWKDWDIHWCLQTDPRLLQLQGEGVGSIPDSGGDEEAEDEDGPEASTVCLHGQVCQGCGQDGGDGLL